MPQVRARYKVVGPKTVTHTVRKYKMDNGSMKYEDEEVTEKTWMVYFPQGHATRFNERELRRHNLHLKPRLVDMDTGDILDIGGDAYDLALDIPDRDVVLVEDEELLGNNPASKKATVKA